MNSKNPSNDKLAAFFNGELSAEESDTIRAWYNQSNDRKKELEQLELVWGLADRLTEMEGIDKKGAREKIERRISLRRNQWRVVRLSFQKIAAILIFPILLFTSYILFEKHEINTTEHEIVAAYGTRSQITLPDGSKVWLNSGSKLMYRGEFDQKKRTVHLIGEAFFEVASDRTKPFDVVTESYTVRAVGTEFNVRAYENDEFDTSLEEGATQIFESGQKEHVAPILNMEPGQRAVFSQEQKRLVLSTTDVEQYSTWRDGKLTFKNTPMEEVVAKLKRWFNVNIILEGPEPLNYRYTAVFENETIREVLEMLSYSAPIQYKIIPGEKREGDSLSKSTIEISVKK